MKNELIDEQVVSEAKTNLTVMAILYLAIGLFMLLMPNFISNFICYAVGILLIALGVSGAANYMRIVTRTPVLILSLVMSILFILFGIYIFINPTLFASFIPIVIGVFLLLDSINKVSLAFNLKDFGYEYWWHTIIVAVVLFGFGLFLVTNPYIMVTFFIRLLGILLIFDAASNVYALYSYSKK